MCVLVPKRKVVVFSVDSDFLAAAETGNDPSFTGKSTKKKGISLLKLAQVHP
jgi:hypothetical protein